MAIVDYEQKNPTFAARTHYHNEYIDDSSKEEQKFTVTGSDMNEGNLVSSQCYFDPDVHLPLFDLDGVAAEIYESSTEGHHHLYINHPVSWDSYVRLLDAMADCGIVDKFWVEHQKERGFALLRHPSVEKDEGHYSRRNY